ncbi:hypothetical protein PR048_008406 [Dryococelus australis]|uniref:Uncharacterized protein n=1 Tax=Dryococelus australis TaxID=614101 RepID=A0ABQ9HX10_9NEOP|nr:hypothetical protein PR048_008406 [Dryococelus australis]
MVENLVAKSPIKYAFVRTKQLWNEDFLLFATWKWKIYKKNHLPVKSIRAMGSPQHPCIFLRVFFLSEHHQHGLVWTVITMVKVLFLGFAVVSELGPPALWHFFMSSQSVLWLWQQKFLLVSGL